VTYDVEVDNVYPCSVVTSELYRCDFSVHRTCKRRREKIHYRPKIESKFLRVKEPATLELA
jgi:hypothetical protein